MTSKIVCGNCGHEGQIEFKPPVQFVKCSKCGGVSFLAESADVADLIAEKVQKDGWPIDARSSR